MHVQELHLALMRVGGGGRELERVFEVVEGGSEVPVALVDDRFEAEEHRVERSGKIWEGLCLLYKSKCFFNIST